MRKKFFYSMLFFLFAIFIFAQPQQNERVLRVGIESKLSSLDPWETGYAVDAKVLWNIFEPLVVLEENSTRIKPYLAASWKASNNNRTWALKLREGVKFHDDSSLTADDVIASVSVFQPFEAKVEKIEQFAIRFTLPEPNSGFLYKLANIKYPIASAEAIQQYKSLKQEERLQEFVPVGSGPFKFSRWEKGKEIIMESFANYWQGTPWLKKVIYQIIPDTKARISALEQEKIDVVDVIYPADLIRIKKNPKFKIISTYGMNVCYIGMNITHKPLDNIKVRQAFSIAVDKLRLVRMFYYGGYGVPTNRILSPAFWGFSAVPKPGNYNPVVAKRLLAEADYEKGLTLKLVCVPRARPYIPDPQGVAEEIKKQMAEIGVKVNVVVPPSYDDFASVITNREYDLILSGWIDTSGDPDYTLDSLLSGKLYSYNLSGWSNKLFDEKLKAARQLPLNDIRGRIRLYNEAQKIFQEEAPWIPLVHTKIFVIHHRKVKGIIFYPSTLISYHKVRLES